MYWLACLVGMTTALFLARLFLVQVRMLLEEVARVVCTWRAIRDDLTLRGKSTEGRIGHSEPQAEAKEHGAERDRTSPRPELP